MCWQWECFCGGAWKWNLKMRQKMNWKMTIFVEVLVWFNFWKMIIFQVVFDLIFKSFFKNEIKNEIKNDPKMAQKLLLWTTLMRKLFLGPPRNKVWLLYLQLNQNMSQQHTPLKKHFGFNKFLPKSFSLLKSQSHFIQILSLPLHSPKMVHIMHEQSTLIFSITSFISKFK